MKMKKISQFISLVLCFILVSSVIVFAETENSYNDSYLNVYDKEVLDVEDIVDEQSVLDIIEVNFNTKTLSDKTVLTIGVGNEKGEIGYSNNMKSGGSGPEAFTVNKDDAIFIVDNINKRINIYRDGKFIYDIDTPYVSYVRSIVVSQDMIYLMDYDMGMIYILDIKGSLIKSITLPDDMSYLYMLRLYVKDDGSVWLYYDSNDGKGTVYSYLVNELNSNRRSYSKGFSVNAKTYNVNRKNAKSATITSSINIEVTTTELLGQLRILGIDKDNSLFIDVYEQTDTSIVAGEYTVKKYSDDKCISIAVIDLDKYYFMPNNVIQISDEGDLYQMLCLANEVQIIKKNFIAVDDFKSNIIEIKRKALEVDNVNLYNDSITRNIINAPNNRSTALTVASGMATLTWTYNSRNAVNPSPTTVTIPSYLANASKPSSQTGIPYCWGGNNNSTSFTNAMNGNTFAGNINATGGHKAGTAGVDCSGYVGLAAGFTTKLGTTHLATNNYTFPVDPSARTQMDIYVQSGSHVMFYNNPYSEGIITWESTTTGTQKAKAFSRTTAALNGYTLKRFHGW
ncbi:MAG: hypothetical protein LBC96_03035 [Lachnospiraceae bacterium]|jgi:hypothetical protein|nr:hypothetical protein [Lachnospiraceae bacterium]